MYMHFQKIVIHVILVYFQLIIIIYHPIQGGCVGATTGYIVRAPGNDRQTGGPGAFTTQAECITENESRPPVDFVHTGGEMAFRVYDENYNDNSDGPVVFSLTRTDC